MTDSSLLLTRGKAPTLVLAGDFNAQIEKLGASEFCLVGRGPYLLKEQITETGFSNFAQQSFFPS